MTAVSDQDVSGIDFALAENFLFRPTFLAGLTNTAFDWGVGAGVAYTF